MNKWLLRSTAKPTVFALCLLPFIWLFYRALADQLGANPQEALIRATGDWALRF
ncbi:MAG: sulfoxide reductase heme-binding subunit YedZ, partial [Polaromonas sp.]